MVNIPQMMDEENIGSVDFLAMRQGLQRLKCTPAIHLTAEDWTVLAHGRESITFEDFDKIIRRQLMPYVQRRIGTLMIEADAEDSHLSGPHLSHSRHNSVDVKGRGPVGGLRHEPNLGPGSES